MDLNTKIKNFLLRPIPDSNQCQLITKQPFYL